MQHVATGVQHGNTDAPHDMPAMQHDTDEAYNRSDAKCNTQIYIIY